MLGKMEGQPIVRWMDSVTVAMDALFSDLKDQIGDCNGGNQCGR